MEKSGLVNSFKYIECTTEHNMNPVREINSRTQIGKPGICFRQILSHAQRHFLFSSVVSNVLRIVNFVLQL